MKFHSLKTKILTIFSIFLFIFLLIFGANIYYFTKHSIEDEAIDEMFLQAETIINHLDKFGTKNIKSLLPYVIVKNHKIIKKSYDFKITDIKQFLKDDEDFFLLDSKKEAIFTLKDKTYTILIYNTIHTNLRNIFLYIFIFEAIFFSFITFLVNNLLNKIINPIKNINKSAKELSIGDFKSHIPQIKQNNEISELIDTFNKMIDRLKNEVEKIERFNSDVSHELKSPLTVINAQIELAIKKQRDIPYYKKSLNIIQEESNKIHSIVEDLLLLSKINSKIEFTLCDFNAILIDVIEKLSFEADKKNINLEIKVFKQAIKTANKSLIRAIFTNIIENSIKYSKEKSSIHISLFTNTNIHFIVEDNGVGISKQDLDKITNRFYRVDESRNKTIKGFGLGLSIVKNAVEVHSGELKIDSKIGVGTTIEITI